MSIMLCNGPGAEAGHCIKTYLLELHYVGMEKAAVINDLTLYIYARKPFSPLKKFDGNLHHLPESVQIMVKVKILRCVGPPCRSGQERQCRISPPFL